MLRSALPGRVGVGVLLPDSFLPPSGPGRASAVVSGEWVSHRATEESAIFRVPRAFCLEEFRRVPKSLPRQRARPRWETGGRLGTSREELVALPLGRGVPGRGAMGPRRIVPGADELTGRSCSPCPMGPGAGLTTGPSNRDRAVYRECLPPHLARTAIRVDRATSIRGNIESKQTERTHQAEP